MGYSSGFRAYVPEHWTPLNSNNPGLFSVVRARLLSSSGGSGVGLPGLYFWGGLEASVLFSWGNHT